MFLGHGERDGTRWMWTTSLCWISGSTDFPFLSSLLSPENEGSVGPSVKQKPLLGLPSGAGEKMGEAEREKSIGVVVTQEKDRN